MTGAEILICLSETNGLSSAKLRHSDSSGKETQQENDFGALLQMTSQHKRALQTSGRVALQKAT